MMKTFFFFLFSVMLSSISYAQTCPFPTCIEWYENGQCAQTTCDDCIDFMCTDWYQNGQCMGGTCQPTCDQPQCNQWHENGQCMHASC